ncbi:MAG TPA: alpha-amylase family glycosyl hydrolase [Anaerolineales bacterium]|nr:alpha-amylase family glycosyl hydrolase [Anaerolineales bacterium]
MFNFSKKSVFRQSITFSLFLLLLQVGGLFLTPPRTPVQAAASNWCIAGGFQGWNNNGTYLYDDGTNGDVIPNDNIFTLDYTLATAGDDAFKILECGNWGIAYPNNNAYVHTTAPNQVVRFTFDANSHVSDAGIDWLPAANRVHAADTLVSAFTVVGTFQSGAWNNADAATAMTAEGNGIFRLAYTVPSAGTYDYKITNTGGWDYQVGPAGRGFGPHGGASNAQFTTTAPNQTVVFLLDAFNDTIYAGVNGSNTANYCAVGEINGWDNAGLPMNDNGTNGDLLGGDGVYSRDITVASAGTYRWKVTECSTWNTTPAGFKNSWLVTSTSSQTVKVTFDTNNHSGDVGTALFPQTNILNAWDTPLSPITAVGDFQSTPWTNPDAGTALTNNGHGFYALVYSVPSAGAYQGKLAGNGAWTAQINKDDGRGYDSDGGCCSTVPFTISVNGQSVYFVYDARQGRTNVLTFAPPYAPNSIDVDNLRHDSRAGVYRNPGGAQPYGTDVVLRLRATSTDLQSAQVRVWKDRENSQILLNMTKVLDDGTYEWWEATVPASTVPNIYYYRFIAKDGTATAYYEDDSRRLGGLGQAYTTSPDNSWQITFYDPSFHTPDWVKQGVMYQIFPDRFRDGVSANNPTAGNFFYAETGGSIVRSNGSDWNTPICDPRDAGDTACFGSYSRNFYGGDLQGITQKINDGYFDDLGVTILYLNPIFLSPSNHKYDTADYGQIDPAFGGKAAWDLLVAAADAHGIRIVLDGVFNHVSSDSKYLDRYSRYDSAGVLTSPSGPGTDDNSGACESTTSPYRSWFYFNPATPPTNPAVCDGDTVYTSWFGYDSLPKLNASLNAVRDLIWQGATPSPTSNIAEYWLNQGASGWRLDVGGDVDPGVANEDPLNPNGYWEGFRSAIRSADPEAYVVGEEWGMATAWTLGSEWDATMNYQFSSAVLSFWRDSQFVDNDRNTGSSAGVLAPLTPEELNERLLNLEERYPKEALYAMMNLLGSHDTNRALFYLDERADENDATIYENASYDWSPALTKLKGVALLQMTLPGAPTIYYGDEIGLIAPPTYTGGTWQDDPYNRIPYPWSDASGSPMYPHLAPTGTGFTDLLPYYQLLTATRNAHPALQIGSFDPLKIDNTNKVYVYGRLMEDHSDAAVVVVNRKTNAQTVDVNVLGYIAVGTQFIDVLNGGTTYTVSASGVIEDVATPALNGAILVLDGTLAVPPDAPVLSVDNESNGQVDLSWTAVTGADEYVLYRTLLSGGEYVEIATLPSGTLTYSDTGLTNAVKYYYIIVARDTTTKLVSENSNEVLGIPQHTLYGCTLDHPLTMTHTISTTTSTGNLYGLVEVTGFTGNNGPASGITMQLGYAYQAGLLETPGWNWTPMSFDSLVDPHDKYVGSILPERVGTYFYTVRCSSNGGVSWMPGSGIGILTVNASTDTTKPNAPINLTLDLTSPSSIAMHWTASTSPDVAGYRIYRREKDAPSPDGDWAQIDTTAAGTTEYTDLTVEGGVTYEYYVLAYDTSFNNSLPSNIIEATAEFRVVEVTWRVKVPDYSPGTVYIVGGISELCGWCNPQTKAMTQVSESPNIWEYTVDILDGTTVQYKFTRGSWAEVESWGDITGLANRSIVISYGTDGTMLIDLTTGWSDTTPDEDEAVQAWADDPQPPAYQVFLPIILK